MPRPVRLFISYASKDAHWRDRLLIALAPSIEAGLIDPWHDRKIEAGEQWHAEIFERIAWADAALLLFSQVFFNSKFIIKKEVPVLQKRYESEKWPLIPILLDHCDYEPMAFLHSLQLLNVNNRPLASYKPPTRTLTDISKLLRKRLETVVLQPDTPAAKVLDTSTPKTVLPLSLNQLLERRLDAVVYRMKFAPTPFAARQFVNHGHILVNGRRLNISSYQVRDGDVIEVRQKAKQNEVILTAITSGERDIPDYLSVDKGALKGTFMRAPALADVPYPVQMEPNMVVEFYSR
ncbi:small subunit ribosomal protein S4 [uncultured Gammaproteobacteria bacterium]